MREIAVKMVKILFSLPSHTVSLWRSQMRCSIQFYITAVGHSLSKSPRNPWLSFPGAISSMLQRKSSYLLLASQHQAEEQMVWSFRKMEIDGLRRIRPFRSIYLMRNEALSWHRLFLRWQGQQQVWRWAGETTRSEGTWCWDVHLLYSKLVWCWPAV